MYKLIPSFYQTVLFNPCYDPIIKQLTKSNFSALYELQETMSETEWVQLLNLVHIYIVQNPGDINKLS